MIADHWPLVDLRLQTPRLVLRVPSDEELAALGDVAANGVHGPAERPFLTPWTDQPPAQRALHVIQQHWSRRGAWSPTSWVLELAMFRDGQAIGLVGLRARDFAVLREVTTESWLGVAHQRQGFGTEARAALLHLAFEGLSAVSAVSEVFQDNTASQAVSRRAGYQPDGISRDVLDGRAVTSDRLRLNRGDWQPPANCPVAVLDLEPCLHLFGL